jgi:purine-binding chemotaxis protein CheW
MTRERSLDRETDGDVRRGTLSRRRGDKNSDYDDEYLIFYLAGEAYGAPLRSIGEVVRPGAITRVPGARRDVRGVTSVRGRLVTVVDLRLSLGVANREGERLARLMLSESEDDVVGYLVDEVRDVEHFSSDEIEGASVLGTPDAAHLLGVARRGKDVFVLLELDALSPVLAEHAEKSLPSMRGEAP